MNIAGWGSRLYRSSPAGLILTGAALALAIPPVRRGLRLAAVMATRGVYLAAAGVTEAGARVKEGMEDIMAEAKNRDDREEALDDQWDKFKEKARRHRHRAAVAAAAGVLTVTDKAKELRQELHDIVDEAKQARSVSAEPEHGKESDHPTDL